MGRPRKQNPKNKHIGIVTTEEKFRRFKSLGLVGDEAIDVLLYYLENENMELQISKHQTISKIKNIEKDIENLEYEKLKQETKLEEINQKIGFDDKGMQKDVGKAIKRVIQRYRMQSIFTIEEFMHYNKNFIEDQAYLCNVPFEEFKSMVIENI